MNEGSAAQLYRLLHIMTCARPFMMFENNDTEIIRYACKKSLY